IRREMPGISQKVLTQQLRELVSDDLILRTSTGRVPAPVEYSLTDYGRSLLPLVEKVRTWGRGHIEKFRELVPETAAGSTRGAPSGRLPAPINAARMGNPVQPGSRRDREPRVVSTAPGVLLPTSRSSRG
ncbi:MAG: helix-turn-helix transcriptional regulator, partial [Acidobacteriota bacterium]|nr:helix-turn-helix transcriptional regulator [Acidobacteriota bacterium]